MNSSKVFWEQRLVRKMFHSKGYFPLQYSWWSVFWKGVCSLLECCLWRKGLKIRCRIFSCLCNRLNPSLFDLTEAMTVIRIISCVECLAESLICVSEGFNKSYFVVYVYICIMGERDSKLQVSHITEHGQSSWDHHEVISCFLQIDKLIN